MITTDLYRVVEVISTDIYGYIYETSSVLRFNMWINVTYSISICIVNVVLKSKNKKKFYILFLSRTSISKTVDRVKFEPLPLYINPLLSSLILTQTLNFQTKSLHQFPIPASNAYFETTNCNKVFSLYKISYEYLVTRKKFKLTNN